MASTMNTIFELLRESHAAKLLLDDGVELD